MNEPSSSLRNLARQLLVASGSTGAGATDEEQGPAHEAVAVCETLRIAVTRFAGPDGFAALVRRALILARLEAPVLQSVRIGANNTLEGLEEIAAEEQGADAAVVLTAHVLMLLVTFIGESLTMRFVREAWPNAKLDL